MTKRFKLSYCDYDWWAITDTAGEIKENDFSNNISGEIVVDLLNELNDENEQLKQYKQAVSDVLIDWSNKNLTAKQLQVVIAIMEELNINGDVE